MDVMRTMIAFLFIMFQTLIKEQQALKLQDYSNYINEKKNEINKKQERARKFINEFVENAEASCQGQQLPDTPRIVNFLTKDLLAPEDVKFSRQNALKLPCDAVGSNLQWTWKHNGTDITTGGKFTIGADGTLYGSYLESAQSGHYQCFVRDTSTGIETFSRKIQVAVTVVGTFSNQNEQEVLVDLGQEFSYNCPQHSPSYGVSYSWQGKINTVDILFKRNDRRAISQTGQLSIMYVTQEDLNDFAQYDNQGIRCLITGANRFESSGILKLKKKTPGQTDPQTKRAPAWKLIPANTEMAVEGRNKTLYCLAVGRPVPTITWKIQNKDGNWKNLVHGQDSFEIASAFQGRLLNIISVKDSMHETRYRCEAENSESGGSPLVHDIQLNVEVAPRFTASPPQQVEIDVNGNGSLTCDVFADPSPSFKWYKNGRQLTTSTVQVTLRGNRLEFKNVRYPGEIGIYQCVAENPHGMIVSSTYVKVLPIKPSFVESGFGPLYLFKGTEGRLKCNPKAAPRPSKDQYKWYKGTTLLTSSPPYRIVHGEFSTLIIDNVDKNRDEGLYKCYAENFLGNDEATATATVLERTIITVRPEDKQVDEGTRVDLRCEATADPSLELKYYWKRDNAVTTYNNKIQWLEGAKVLTIASITVDEAGNYTCVAYTPDPKRSEDQASATIDIAGAPYPPTNLAITDCLSRSTTLSWVTGAANNASITRFIIEQESAYEPNVFYPIENVTEPNATSITFNLTGWATLRFRLRAVNRFGPSRASVATTEVCRTDVGPPDKYPDNFRGNPKGAEELDIVWTAMPKVDWNAPGIFYLLKYRQVPDGQFGTPEKITDPTVDVFAIPNPGYYKLWEFQIQAGNDVNLGPKSPVVQSYSGQDPPEGKPGNVQTGAATARTVQLSWQPVTVTRGSVDGYKIYYWGKSRLSARRRREIPGYASFVNVRGGSTDRHNVTELTPYTNYIFAITAYNSGGEGPASNKAFAATEEDVPGPPSTVNVYAFAKYILVTWKAPVEPNGVITKYRVRSVQYDGSQPGDDLQVSWQEVGPGVFRKLLDNQTPERNYVVEMQAETSKGWGEQVRKTTRTVKYAPPAKPERPTVEGTHVDEVKVTYNFGLGGGYTHEFLVMYRRKLKGETFQNSSWINHFETQSIKIGGLNNELYEFKTVGRNDYPDDNDVNSRSESPASDVTKGRPLPPLITSQPLINPIHKTAWFITLLIIIVVVLIVLLIFVHYTRHQGTKYLVRKREKERALIEHELPYDEEEGALSDERRLENPPPYQSQSSLRRIPENDRDSLDDYGEGHQFDEDGSFIEEYVEGKNNSQDGKDSALATFV